MRVRFIANVLYGNKQYVVGEEVDIKKEDYENLKYVVRVLEQEKEEGVEVVTQEEKMKNKKK